MWRDRLRSAIESSGVTHAEIARRAGLAPETLSRVIRGRHARPEFSTVVRIARAARVSVAWLLDESFPGIQLTARERDVIRQAGVILLDAITRAERSRQ